MKLTNGCFVCHIAELSRYQKGDTPVSKKIKKKKKAHTKTGDKYHRTERWYNAPVGAIAMAIGALDGCCIPVYKCGV